MSLAIVGTTAVGISKNADTSGMSSSSSMSSSMSSMKPSSGTTANSGSNNVSEPPRNIIINFFSGVVGQVILLLSFGAMFAGIWFSGDIRVRKFLLPISLVGAAILYISMYNYYFIALEIIGVIVLIFVYASIFSHRVAKMVKVA